MVCVIFILGRSIDLIVNVIRFVASSRRTNPGLLLSGGMAVVVGRVASHGRRR
jgi:hypothetical protein